MNLEIYEILILISIGALVGIGMSFMGQTGQGLVMPIILMLTGNPFLAISVNLLNDLIAAVAVSIGYIRKGEYKLQANTLIIIIIALIFACIGVYVLMVTPLESIYGWFIPAFIICLGLIFIKSGYATIKRLKTILRNFYNRFLRSNEEGETLNGIDRKTNDKEIVKNNEIQEVIPYGSKLFYVIAVVFGFLLGINSGMFGANSGFIIVLALIILYGYPIKKSIGTALILSIIVSILTFTLYQVFGAVIKGTNYFNLEITVFLACGSVITGFITSAYIQRLSAKIMGRAMGIIMVILGTTALTFYFIT
ncbi:MAG: sulfite exporter TauE/SafE family protein [Candidatus Odinarchaeota archaeon]